MVIMSDALDFHPGFHRALKQQLEAIEIDNWENVMSYNWENIDCHKVFAASNAGLSFCEIIVATSLGKAKHTAYCFNIKTKGSCTAR